MSRSEGNNIVWYSVDIDEGEKEGGKLGRLGWDI